MTVSIKRGQFQLLRGGKVTKPSQLFGLRAQREADTRTPEESPLNHIKIMLFQLACQNSHTTTQVKKTVFFTFYLVDVCQGLFILHQHLGKLKALIWADPHHASQQENPVRCITNLENFEELQGVTGV